MRVHLENVMQQSQKIVWLCSHGNILSVPLVQQSALLHIQRGKGVACLCVGKRELPAALRNRFTEAYIAEPTARADLRAVVAEYLSGAAPNPPLDAVVDFYVAAKHEAVSNLCTHASHNALCFSDL